MNENVKVSIDYLTFTYKLNIEPEIAISSFLGMSPDLFEHFDFGLMGYRKSYQFGGIYILYDGDNSSDYSENTMSGICVSMSGSGCRCFDEFTKFKNKWDSLFTRINERDCNVTRIDIACDDFTGILNIDQLIFDTKMGNVRSKMKKRQIVLDLDGTRNDGCTIYFGAPSSDTRIRIYDKAKEQEDTFLDHWIRCEIVLKHEQALAFARLLPDACVGKLASLVLNDKLSFINQDDSNISRCSTKSYWVEFVNELDSVVLITSVKVKPCIERSAEWFRLQIAPSFAMLWDSIGYDLIIDLLEDGRKRLSIDQSAIVREYRSVFKNRG